MSSDTQVLSVAAVMFFAALTRSTFGFGEALVAMPLLVQVLNVQTATAVVAVTSLFHCFVILAKGSGATDWRSGWRLLVASLAGIPVGVAMLTHVPEAVVKMLLAAVLVAFSLFNLYRPGVWRLRHDNWAYLFGFVGGVLGGAYNTAGPPFVVFGLLRGWSPAQLRCTLQGVFLPNVACVVATHYFQGLWSADMLRYLAWTLPLVLVTAPLGYYLNRRIHPEHFHRLLHLLVLGLAGMLLWSIVR